jgi:RHS repeat-associated protein
MLNTITDQTPTGTAIATDQFSYDGDLRPASSNATWQVGGAIASSDRTYDPVGNVIATQTSLAAVAGQTNSGGNETQSFCYDEQNRLVWAGNSGTQPAAGSGTCGNSSVSSTLNGASYSNSFAYTHLDQLWQGPLQGSSTSSQYLYCDPTHPHQLTRVAPLGTSCTDQTAPLYALTYDAWGNVVSRSYNGKTAQLSYDALDHFVQWNGDVQEQYAYDGSGERVLRRSTSGSATTLTVYAFGLEEHVYDGGGNPQSNTYYYTLGGHLLGSSDGTHTQFFVTDALGSVLTTFDGSSNTPTVLGNQVYGPYGNQRYQSGSLGTSKGFTGQYADATGLDYYNARYYDPVVGRFLSADTVENNANGNDPYAYVKGNPETATDPTGHLRGDPSDQAYGLPSSSNVASSNFDDGPLNTFSHDIPIDVNIPAYPTYSCDYDCGGYSLPPSTPTPPSTGSGGGGSWVSSVGSAIWHGADAVLGISSMVHDVHTITGNGSAWDKLYATGDLIMNVGMDASMVTGVGEDLRAGQLLLRGGADLADRLAEEGGADTLEHLAESCGGGLSFASQTAVTTATGAQAIGSLKPGEKVLAYNPQTKKMEYQPIVHIWINHDNDLVDLTLTTKGPASKTYETSETLHTNKKHPFLTVEQGFVPVGQLKLGMHVVEADGLISEVTGWKSVPGTQTMYNLEVAQDHTYMVGAGQWVVHNANCFDVVSYRPSNAPLENHHGILDKWASENIPGYVSRAADNPTVALTKAQHDATKAVYRDWLYDMTGRRVGGKINWTAVSPRDIYDLSERMFDSAGVPNDVRQEYYSAFNQYIYR